MALAPIEAQAEGQPAVPVWENQVVEHELSFGAAPELKWKLNPANSKYLIQISDQANFSSIVREEYSVGESFQWHEAQPGKYFARVYGLNSKFVRSPSSDLASLSFTVQAPQKMSLLSAAADPVSNRSQFLVGWEPNPFAQKFELQVSESESFDKPNVYRTRSNVFPLMLGITDTRYVRVLALNDLNEAVSVPSSTLLVHSQTERGFASTEIETVSEDPNNASSDSPFWRRKKPIVGLTFGLGTNYFQLKQTRSDGADSEYKGMMAPTIMAEATYNWSKALSFSLSYHQFLGKLQARTFLGQTGADFKWETTAVEGKYLVHQKDKLDYSLLLGLQQHRTPNGFLNSDNTITFEYETITNLSLGGMIEYLATPDLILESFLRLQHPAFAKGSGGSEFTLQSRLIFDGSLGVIKHMGEAYRLGFYWFGQYHNFAHEGQSAGAPVSGTRDYLNSNLQFRFGYDFH
jgi:hypothetical protein